MKNARIATRSEMKNIFGGYIRKYRDELCYTQEFMADQLGITQSAYYKIESGTVKVSIEKLEQIAQILGKPMDAFLQNKTFIEQHQTEQKVVFSLSELELLQKTITAQQKRIEELEAKITRRNSKIEELKLQVKI